MDEATSSIDQKTDSTIRSVMQRQLNGKTVIAIAHKLLTILDYDEVLVFDQGVIVERGTPKGLIEKQGRFYEMIIQNQQIAERTYKILGLQKKQMIRL